ncbi:tetratricopeptide repeat protein [Thalassobaculum sp.]|uniref:tetratricopeptide repeat protein n=1 Tax=Thalassobaculum sp. TaxID=2022740 RepID=UPI0032EAA8BE
MTVDPASVFAAAVQAGDWAAADRALDALLYTDPDNPVLHYNRGLVCRRMGRLAEAVAAHDAVLARAPDHANAAFERASCLLDLGRLEDAAAGFGDYLKQVPEDPDARLNRARIALRLGRPDDALRDLNGLDDSGPAIRLARAESLRDLRRLDEAETLLAPSPGDDPGFRAAALKLRTQGPAGRLRLDEET